MGFLQCLSAVCSLGLVCLAGLAIVKTRLLPESFKTALPKLVTYVALPPYLFHSIVTTMDSSELAGFLAGTFVPFASIFLSFATAWALGKMFHVKHFHSGLYLSSFSTSSAIFIGIPICEALCGTEGIPYALLYYFANATFFWTIGSYLIIRDGSTKAERITVRKFFRNLLSPPFLGFFAGLLFALFGWRLPEFCMRALHTVGQLTTPLSLIFIGISLADMRLTRECLSRDLLLASAGRLVISPLIMAAVVALCDVKGVMGTIFILQSALPAVMQAAILSANYKTDPEFGTLIVSLTTLLSILTVPLVMSLV